MEITNSGAECIILEDLTKDGEVFWNDARVHESKDVEMETLIERSNYQDEKVRKKEENANKKEEEYKRKREAEKSIIETKIKQNQNLKRMERKKSKTKQKNEMKLHSKTNVSKPYLRELPPTVKKIVGDNFVSFPVDGDGACGPRSLAAWIYEDPTLGPHLARNMNHLFIKHWDYWADKFNYPFIRNIGCGKQIRCANENELLKFFQDSEDGAFMWRGHEDFQIVANAYQVKITIITIRGMKDQNPETTIIEPNPDFKNYAEIPPGIISDMMILHEHDVHYSLIIPEDSRLAENGGLDFQRSENVKNANKKSELFVTKTNICETTTQKELKTSVGNVKEHPDKNEMDIFLKESSMHGDIVLNADIAQKDSSVIVNKTQTNKTSMLGDIESNAEIAQKDSNINVMKTHKNGTSTLVDLELNADIAQKDLNTNMMKTNTSKINIQKFESLEKKLASLEQRLKLLVERVEVVENENRLLKDKVKSDNQKHMEEQDKGNIVEEGNEEELLHLQKKRGFKRVGPYVQSEMKLMEKEFSCDICGTTLQSKGLLDAHSKSHASMSMKTGLNCDKKYDDGKENEKHKEQKYRGMSTNRQFNCLDCASQGEKSLDLRKHILRTQHTPCEYKEECYDCGKQFDSYYYLMNHRREEHKSNKPCRYFLENRCNYEAEKCWYKHEEKAKMINEHNTDGQLNQEGQDSVFHRAVNKTPPDQMNSLSEIIKQMTIHMKSLKTIAQVY